MNTPCGKYKSGKNSFIDQLRKKSSVLLLIWLFVFVFFLPSDSFAEKTAYTTYGAKDYRTYLRTPFAKKRCNPLVKEGFDALDHGNTREALELLRKAANRGCQSPLVFFKIALAFESQSSHYSAIQYYDLARKNLRKYHASHRYNRDLEINYARSLYFMGQFDKAIPLFEKLAQKRRLGWIYQLLGNHYFNKDNKTKGLFYLEKLFSLPNPGLEPTQAIELLTTMARTYLNQKDDENARRIYQKVLSIDPQNQEAATFMQNQSQSNGFDDILESLN